MKGRGSAVVIALCFHGGEGAEIVPTCSSDGRLPARLPRNGAGFKGDKVLGFASSQSVTFKNKKKMY